jgi:glycine/D-amino acid oxidase-like deaminating enzyme
MPEPSNYWLSTAELPPGSSGGLARRADVAVIGAGFTGLSAARTLAKQGASVVVVDSNSIGWGASSRNGGMVLTGGKLAPETLEKRYGRELARGMFAASLAAIDLVELIVREENIQCDFSRCGHLEVAAKPSHFEGYQHTAELLGREFNHHLRIVERQELDREIGSKIYFGGLVDEASAGLNPARYVAGLARAALRAGAAIYEGTRVEAVRRAAEDGAQGFAVETTRGTIFAGEVLVATGGYTSRATPTLRNKVIPIGSFIIATEPLGEELARRLSPRNRMIYDSKHYLFYYRLTPDGRMLFGGRAAFFPETRNTVRRSAGILRRGMLRVFPELRGVRIEYAWGGTLDFCFDTMPHVGKLDGLYYALGYAGHGVAMATYLGMKVAEKMAGSGDDVPYAAIPFPGAPLGLYRGRPWFLPIAGAYYKLLDWIS